jgi:hypothetical protein
MYQSHSLILFSGTNIYISPSLLDANVSFINTNYDNNRRFRRTIWTSTPVCMGRRSCKIAGRKVCPFFLFFDNASYLFDEIPVTRVLTSTEFIFISLKQKTIFSLFLNKGYVVATLCIYGPVWINSL